MSRTKAFLWTCLLLAIFAIHAKADWKLESIGNVRHTHFYYEGDELKGICVASEEGMIAMLDHKTGNIVWRNYPTGGRRLQRFVPEGRYLITIVDNYTTAEVLDLSEGKTINTVELNKDMHRLPFTDVHIVTTTPNNFTYAIMTNKEVKVFEKEKEMWSLHAADNETYVFVGYDYARESVVIGSVADDTTEVSTRPVNGALKPFTFTFNPKTDILLKTWQYVLVIRLPPYAQTTMIIAHRIEKREMLFNEIEREVGQGFQIKDLVLPSDLVILKSWKEYAIMVLEDLALKKVQMVSSLEGEYGFGADQKTSRVYMCHSDQNGYKIYEAQPKKAFRVVYSTETELNRRLYGEPEIVGFDL